MAEWYSILCMYHIFLIHSSVNGHWDCFLVLAIVNRAALNIAVNICVWIRVLSGCMHRREMAGSYNGHELEQTPGDGEGQGSLACCSPWGHKELDTTENWRTTVVILFLFFWGISILFSIEAVPTYIPTNNVGGLPFLDVFSSFCFFGRVFTDGRPDWCELVPQFWLAFLQLLTMLSFFSCAWWSFIFLLWRNVYLGLLPTFWWGCSFFVIELYELFIYFGN